MSPKIRLALFSEQRELARVYTAAFWDDVLFGDLIHPHRKEFPEDNQLYWLRRIQVYWWDYTHHFIVSTAVDKQGDEVIAGVAHWSRTGTGGRAAGLGWWDPRKSDLEHVIASRRTVLPLVRSYSHRKIGGSEPRIPSLYHIKFLPAFPNSCAKAVSPSRQQQPVRNCLHTCIATGPPTRQTSLSSSAPTHSSGTSGRGLAASPGTWRR